jgi:serine/threonine protein phosphatase PrpC
MQLAVSVLSRSGARPVNEDACGFWTGNGVCVCVVSDGAGGHGGGDVASKLVVSRVLGWFREDAACEGTRVERALAAANEALLAAQTEDPQQADMRATAVVLAMDTERDLAVWGNLGDSRLYGFRGGEAVARTRDHSVLQQMIDAGYLKKKEELRAAPNRSTLFAALGDAEGFEPYVERTPFKMRGGDAFLLCTDGCWEHVEEAEMIATLAEAATPDGWLRALEERVIARGGNGQDNYSAIAVWCERVEC